MEVLGVRLLLEWEDREAHVAHALLAARVDRRGFGVGHVLAVEDV